MGPSLAPFVGGAFLVSFVILDTLGSHIAQVGLLNTIHGE